MQIYDEGIFNSQLNMEIARSERFGIPFSLMAIKTIDDRNDFMAVLNIIITANYRKTDVIAKRKDGTYLILLNGTDEEKSISYLNRIISTAVKTRNTPLAAAVVGFKIGDEAEKMIDKVIAKIR